MSEKETCPWPGRSGRNYTYYVHPLGASFKSRGGNYLFCKRDYLGRWTPQYIGQTSDLSDRLADHEKEACAHRNGATHIHANLNANESTRLVEESDLVLMHRPPCNERLLRSRRAPASRHAAPA